MIIGTLQCALLVAALGRACGERWRWPDDAEAAESVRIDTKVGFVDDQPTRRRNNRQNIQADDISSQQPQGSYSSRPARYPDRDLRINGRPAYNDGYTNEKYQDGTLDSLQYCKCVSTPNCEVRNDYANACGANQYLCCYKNPQQNEQQPEYFNEVDDVRPMLFPGQSNKPGLLPRPNYDNNIFEPGQGQGAFQSQAGTLVGPDGPTGVVGPNKPGVAFPERPVLVGPSGPTGVIGPGGPAGVKGPANDRPVLVGPDGPTGVIGPGNNRPVHVGPSGSTGVKGSANDRPVLVGPDGPTGVIGPSNNRPVLVGPGSPTGVTGPDNNRPVLVGPGGPTGMIGPANDDRNDNLLVRPLGSSYDTRPSETAQRGVLVGPGGPTGIIGPAFDLPYLFGSSGFGGSARPVLVGPGGPTGTIGPRLVGPGGPTGRIGPDFNRRTRGPGILVGPGGPTGRIGPRNFFGI